MRTIRYKSRGSDVFLLEQILNKLGYNLDYINTYFDLQTHYAVVDFQRENSLVVDGIVGQKTWSVLLIKEQEVFNLTDKFLGEEDIVNFADEYGLEIAVVKAVNEVESLGGGFLIDGRPRILFEGHVFWRQLSNAGVNPSNYVNNYTKNVLYPSWTRSYYEGGSKEYSRLDKAAGMSDNPTFRESALGSASWGAFQILGYHAKELGYPSVEYFVSNMYEHEREHLKAFGRFIKKNGLIPFLKNKDWRKFAKGYNGPGYAKNNYHIKLERAYNKYKSM